MTTFQKLIAVILIIFLGMSGFYFYRQEQIKKSELELEESQKQISDCKYLLANRDLLMKDEDLGLKLFSDLDSEDPVRKKTFDEWQKASEDYRNSMKFCSNLLRNLDDLDNSTNAQ